MLFSTTANEINMMTFLCTRVQIGRLHCLLPWWEDSTVDFMISGGYNVVAQIEHVCFPLGLSPTK